MCATHESVTAVSEAVSRNNCAQKHSLYLCWSPQTKHPPTTNESKIEHACDACATHAIICTRYYARCARHKPVSHRRHSMVQHIMRVRVRTKCLHVCVCVHSNNITSALYVYNCSRYFNGICARAMSRVHAHRLRLVCAQITLTRITHINSVRCAVCDDIVRLVVFRHV